MPKIYGIESIIFDWVGTLYQFNGKGLFPYSESVLKKLQKKYKLAVISKVVSNDLETRMIQINEIAHYFKVRIVGLDKTQSDFVRCLKELKTEPENTLVVDDRTIRGIKIGNNLGCKTVWVRKGHYEHETPDKETGNPTHTIDTIENLQGVLV